MKKFFALLLSAVLLLSVAAPAAFAVEYADTYETAINLARNDLTDLDNLNDAVAMLSQLGSYGFSKRYVIYFQQIAAVQGEAPDLAAARLVIEVCQADSSFTADLEERGLPSCADLLTYIGALEREAAGDLRAAYEAFSRMSLLDAPARAVALALEPMSPLFHIPMKELQMKADALIRQAQTWTRETAPQTLAQFPLMPAGIFEADNDLANDVYSLEPDGPRWFLRTSMRDRITAWPTEKLEATLVSDGYFADGDFDPVTFGFSAPDGITVEKLTQVTLLLWLRDFDSTGMSELIEFDYPLKNGKPQDRGAVMFFALSGSGHDIVWSPRTSQVTNSVNDSVFSVVIREFEIGEDIYLDYDMGTGNLIAFKIDKSPIG